ncbi:hypothetical protein BUALT_Bualt05G0006900 [Buddleja alternifolia]|uniref:Uncharacterized protein n=1 Tax=Buddleja alternifolia TaxID=168488 RepID=A0AAV6XP04_9LAMI|nr:hypothetical protein BUALT_Bualt05G0006900 [Buddleja alternifolia]
MEDVEDLGDDKLIWSSKEEDYLVELMVNKEYKQFRKKGCDHFELLCEIFNETVATGHLARSSTQGPLNSEEELEVEEVFLHGTTKNPLFNDVEDISDSPIEKKSKKKRAKGDAHEGSSRVKNQCLDSSASDAAWNAFRDAQLSKKLVYDKASGPSKEEECVDILEKMEGITTMQFVNAIHEFKDASIRITFLRMSEARRIDWVLSLAP